MAIKTYVKVPENYRAQAKYDRNRIYPCMVDLERPLNETVSTTVSTC